jgi:hypothetical protein
VKKTTTTTPVTFTGAFGRCLSVTLPGQPPILLKVLGEETQAIRDRSRLLRGLERAGLTVATSETPRRRSA